MSQSNRELTVMFKKLLLDDVSSGTWHVILLQAATRIWARCGQKGMDVLNNHTQL